MNAPTLQADFRGCSDRNDRARIGRPETRRDREIRRTTHILGDLAFVLGTLFAWGTAACGAEVVVDGRFEPLSEGDGYVISDGELTPDSPVERLDEFVQAEPCEACGPAACGPACGRRCPKWTVQVDALMLWQGAIPSRPLYLDTATQAPVIDADDLQTSVTIDPRYAILYHVDECRAFEVNYFNLSGFEGYRLAPVTTGAYEMSELAGLNYEGLNVAGAASAAAIKSLEFNLRRRGWGDIQWLTGFRWVEWNQQLFLADVFDQGAGFDIFDVSTVNNLYGWQWGGDLMLWNRGDRLRVNGIFKGGVYYNHQAAQRTVFETNRPNESNETLGDGDDTVAFVGETGVMASYSLTNWLAVRVGYTFFWLAGVATPADQLDASRTNVQVPTPQATVSPYGSVMLQGVQTGVEARW